MSAKPYSYEQIEAIRSLIGTIYELDRYERSRICATVDTLRAQLDAAKRSLVETGGELAAERCDHVATMHLLAALKADLDAARKALGLARKYVQAYTLDALTEDDFATMDDDVEAPRLVAEIMAILKGGAA